MPPTTPAHPAEAGARAGLGEKTRHEGPTIAENLSGGQPAHDAAGGTDIRAFRIPIIDPADTPASEVLAGGPSSRALGLLALLGAALGGLGIVLPAPAAVLCVLALVALVPGALILAALPPLPRVLAVAAVPALGAAVVSLTVSAQLALGAFAPEPTRWVLVLAGALGGVLLLRAAASGRTSAPAWRISRPARGIGGWESIAPMALAVVGTVCWVAAVPAVRSAGYSSYGLAWQVPLLPLAVVSCALAVLLAVRAGGLVAAWVGLVALVLARRGITLAATEAPLYQWTYRHLGVMDWFTHSGRLVRDVDVYSNWPGSLALWAWVTEVSGISRFDLASAYILGHHLVLVVAVYVLARTARLSPMGAVTAALLVELADWVGQDYLAPQSFGFLLAIVVIAALLASREGRYRKASTTVAVIVFAGIVWAHQLTPVWLLVVVVLLLVSGAVRPWVLVPFLSVHAVMVAVNLPALLRHSTGISLDFLANTAGNIETHPSEGQVFTSRVVTVLAVVLWGAAMAVVVRRLRRDPSVLVMAALAFSPLVLLVTGYGGEAIYRIFLYSLPGVSLIFAPVIVGWLGRGAVRVAGAIASTLVVALAGLQGSLGGWHAGTFQLHDVDLAVRLEQAAGDVGVIATPTVGFPLQVSWEYASQARADTLGEVVWSLENEYVTPTGVSAEPVDRLTEAARIARPVYVVVSQPMQAYSAQYGVIPQGGLDHLRELLRQRGWTVVVDSGGTRVFANEAGAQAWEQTAAPR